MNRNETPQMNIEYFFSVSSKADATEVVAEAQTLAAEFGLATSVQRTKGRGKGRKQMVRFTGTREQVLALRDAQWAKEDQNR